MDGRDRSLLIAAVGAGALAAAALLRRGCDYELRERTVVITGGSRGLGLVLAREFGAAGARLALCARDPAELTAAETELTERGYEVMTYPCDVTDRAQVQGFFHAVRGRFGPIDVLVNNAGLIQVGPMEEMTLSDFEDAMRIHFYGPLYTILEALPDMKRRGSGRIVNVSSIGGKVAFPHLLPYSASKFALVGLSEGLRAELAKDRVAVTTVIPGLMRTGSPRQAFFKGQHEKEFTWFAIADSLPGSSISAVKAARQIVQGCREGRAEVILSLPAELAVRFHGVFPGLTADLLGLVNRLLPEPGGIGKERRQGKDSETPLAPSILTALTERAAVANNEMG